MGKKLYVGNLSFDATEDEVRSAFSACGDISAVSIVMDRMTGRSRGFAFVEMASQESAQRAINDMNGQSLNGRPLRVSEAVDRPRGGRFDVPRGTAGDRGGADRGGFGGGRERGGFAGDRAGFGAREERGGRRPGADRDGGGRRDRGRW